MANDFHMTVAISPQDAMTGTVRALPLPNGQQATITIPADAYDGQILWFPGYIKDSEKDIHPGALILTVQISSPEEATTNDEDIVQVTAAPSQPVESSQQTPSTYIPEQPSPASTSQRMSRNKMVILALAALLITIISSGVFLSVHAPQATDQTNTPAPNVNATAPSQADYATATSIVSGTATANVSTATAQAQSTATIVTTNPNPYAGGTLSFYDKLNGSSTISDWTSTKGCTFSKGALHALDNDPKYIKECSTQALANISKNFTVEVNVSILRGDSAQIYFRGSSIFSIGYFFMIDASGRYQLVREGESTMMDSKYTTLLRGSSAAIRQGYNQSNTMAVVAQGSTITLYVNGQKIDSTTDSNFVDPGAIGLVASNYTNGSNITEVAFSNLRIWSM